MSFTPDSVLDYDAIEEIIQENDMYDNIDNHIFDDIFFQDEEDKNTMLLVASIMNKVLSFCAEKYYKENGCDTSNCPVYNEFTSEYCKLKNCSYCKKNIGKKSDKTMTKEKAVQMWHELMSSLPNICKDRCHYCRCPLYLTTGKYECNTQYTGIIYD